MAMMIMMMMMLMLMAVTRTHGTQRLLSQSTANGHVSSHVPPVPLPPLPPPTENQERLLSFAIQCLRLAANIAQFVVIIQDIEPHNVRRHHQFQNVDGYAKSGGGVWEGESERQGERGREGGRSVWQPYKVQPELLLHMN